MNATDLQRLAGHLRNHGLRVVALEPELRLHVTNPLNGLFTQEIVAEGGRYVTSSHILAASRPTPPGAS
ncbi:hypothetical protein ACH4E9_08125 [Streptomyces anulatus]